MKSSYFGYAAKLVTGMGLSIAAVTGYVTGSAPATQKPAVAPQHPGQVQAKRPAPAPQKPVPPAVSVAGSTPAPAVTDDSASSPLIGDVDVTAAVDFISKYVDTLDHPSFVYRWVGSKVSGLDHPLSAFSPVGLNSVLAGGGAYWKYWNQTDPGGNRFGTGYYAMTDPVLTRRYGGQQWLMFQTQLPVSFRYIHIINHRWVAVPKKVQTIFKNLGCTIKFTDLYSFFQPTWPATQPEQCRAAMQHIFDDLVQLDGVFYHYQDVPFAPCAGARSEGPAYAGAFLITSARRWADPTDVRVFNSGTTDDPEDRTRVESLYYMHSRSTTFLAPPTPKLKTAQKSRQKTSQPTPEMLWPDLIGQETAPEMHEWATENLFRCVDYGQAK